VPCVMLRIWGIPCSVLELYTGWSLSHGLTGQPVQELGPELAHIQLSATVIPRSSVRQEYHADASEVIFIGFQSLPRLLLSMYVDCTSVSRNLDSQSYFSFFLQSDTSILFLFIIITLFVCLLHCINVFFLKCLPVIWLWHYDVFVHNVIICIYTVLCL
jgi:hypothetical protein